MSNFKKILTLFLALITVFTFVCPRKISAATGFDDSIIDDEFITDTLTDEISLENVSDYLSEIYNSLDSVALEVFNAELSEDAELRAVHLQYVDPLFVAPPKPDVQEYASLSASMSSLTSSLQALNLPSAVYYALKAIGAGIVAALADGPLPLGDLVLAAAITAGVAVIAIHWNSIAPVWNQIVNAFRTAFKSAVQFVVDNLTKLLNLVLPVATVYTITSIKVSNTTVTIDNVQYDCKTKISDLSSLQEKYYIAVRAKKNVYVYTTSHINKDFAKAIMAFGNTYVGVYATSDKYARSLCNITYQPVDVHGYEGYYKHYHYYLGGYRVGDSHCWFPQ